MPGPWITTAELRTALKDTLHVEDVELETFWAGIITRCVDRGYVDLKNYLMALGYSMAQLDAWDDRKIYTLDQSLYFAYIEGGGPEDQSDRDMKRFDRITLLMKMESNVVALSIGGVMVKPGGEGSGAMVGSGRMEIHNAGIDYGTSFGLVVNRRNGKNQYGDDIPPGTGMGIR